MHGGNWIGEKLFMLVMTEAWEKCQTKHAREELIRAVQHNINTGVFGTIDSQAQWTLPVTKDFELKTVSFSAWHVKKVIARLAELAEQLLGEQDVDRTICWRNMLQNTLTL